MTLPATPTRGERAVRMHAGPAPTVPGGTVQKLKRCYADLIDDLMDLRDAATSAEAKRQFSVAITEAETSCMWAVKAATCPD